MADQQNMGTILIVTGGFNMDFSHKGAGGINSNHIASGGFINDGFCNAMGRKDDMFPVRDFIQFIHENSTHCGQTVHHMLIMHDFMPDIDGGTKFVQCFFNNANSTINPCTKPSGFGKDNRFCFMIYIFNCHDTVLLEVLILVNLKDSDKRV